MPDIAHAGSSQNHRIAYQVLEAFLSPPRRSITDSAVVLSHGVTLRGRSQRLGLGDLRRAIRRRTVEDGYGLSAP